MRKIFFLVTLIAALQLVAQNPPADPKKPASQPAATEKAPSSMPTEAIVNEFMRQTFGYDQNLKWRVAEIKPAPDPSLSEVTVIVNSPQGQQTFKFFVTPDQHYAVSGDLIPFGANPFAAARRQLEAGVNGPSRGPANPAITIVEFGDLQCPACKRAQPIIEKLMNEVPNARLVFQQFPLIQLHPWAMTAAKYSLCVDKQNHDAFWKFIDLVYDHQDEMQQMTPEQGVPKLKDYAGQAGVNADQVQACINEPEIEARITKSIALGYAMGITGTPTLFIGGRKIGNVSGIPFDTLKAITEFQAANSK